MNEPNHSGCPDDETLALFADGVLAPAAAQALGRHSESCPDCRAALVALTKLQSNGRGSSAEDHASDDDSVTEGARLGRYIVSKRIGAGAMGVVFEAYDPDLKRRVAVKLLSGATNERVQQRLRREAQSMARVSHRNVVAVYDVGTFGSRAWVAMELIDGSNLRQWLATKPTPSLISAALYQAAQGLMAAHAQGVVHRDFKPDNVLVEKGGRVLVTDFGLSKAELESAPTELASPTLASGTLTGQVFGTPAYMAPEIIERREATPQSDQFAFCVTAVEAYAGRRPFEGETIEALAGNIRRGRWQPGTLEATPASVRTALERGLHSDPAKRAASMAELVHVFAPPTPVRRGWALGLAAGVIAVCSVAAWGWHRQTLCSGGPAATHTAWNEDLKTQLHAAFAATNSPAALESEAEVTRALDQWARRWAGDWQDSCEATRLRGEQTDELMSHRNACLHDRLSEMRRLTTLLVAGDAKMLQQAPRAVEQLPPLSMCSEQASLRSSVRAADPRMRGSIAAAREVMSTLVAQRAAGQWREIAEPTEALAQRAAAIGYAPFEAEALLLRAEALSANGEHAKAGDTLVRAAAAAEAGGDDFSAGRAFALQIRIRGVEIAHYAEGHEAAQVATGISARLGSPEALEVVIGRNEAELLSDEGKHAEAEARLRQVLALQEKSDRTSLAYAATLNAIAAERRHLGDVTGAVKLLEDALALLSARLSPTHPDLAEVMQNIGNTYWSQSKLDEAREWYTKAFVIRQAAYGADSLEVADSHNNLGAVALRQQRLADAEKAFLEVLRIRTLRLGEDHPHLYGGLNNLSVVYRYTDRLEEATKALERALRISLKAHGEAHNDVATTLINLGDAQLAKKDFRASVASYRRAISVSETIAAPPGDLAECYGGLAFPLLAMADFRAALEATEKALKLFGRDDGSPFARGQVHFAHARAVWQLDASKRVQAVKEATESRTVLARAGAQDSELAEVDGWLASHR